MYKFICQDNKYEDYEIIETKTFCKVEKETIEKHLWY